jgi:hypothetical protein
MYQSCWIPSPEDWTDLLKKIHTGQRAITVLWVHDPNLDQDQKASLIPSLDLSLYTSSFSLENQKKWKEGWRTIRWIKGSSLSMLTPLITSIHPTLSFKSTLQRSSSKHLQFTLPYASSKAKESNQLLRNKKEDGGAELWIMVYGGTDVEHP